MGHTVVLIRGWFFTKSWRKHRARNTLIILLLAVFTIQVTPMPAASAVAYPTILEQFVFDHLKERLPGAPPILLKKCPNRGGPPIAESARGWVGSQVSGILDFDLDPR